MPTPTKAEKIAAEIVRFVGLECDCKATVHEGVWLKLIPHGDDKVEALKRAVSAALTQYAQEQNADRDTKWREGIEEVIGQKLDWSLSGELESRNPPPNYVLKKWAEGIQEQNAELVKALLELRESIDHTEGAIAGECSVCCVKCQLAELLTQHSGKGEK